MTTAELLSLQIRQLAKHEEDLAKAAETLQRARLASNEVFNQRFHARLIKNDYPPGTLVLLRNVNDRRSKLDPWYFGPYIVLQKTQGGSYRLCELDGAVFKENVNRCCSAFAKATGNYPKTYCKYYG